MSNERKRQSASGFRIRNGEDKEALKKLREEILDRYLIEDCDEDSEGLQALAENAWKETLGIIIRQSGRNEANSFLAAQGLSESNTIAKDGLEFLTQQRNSTPIWGDGSYVCWSRDQGMVLVGQQGTGKSALVQNVGFSLIGLGPSTILGYTVMPIEDPDQHPLVYVAMDRPAQIQDSMRRMIDVNDEDIAIKVKRRLLVYDTNLPFKADQDPELFVEWLLDLAGGRTPYGFVFDSVKDMLTSINDDSAGLAFNDVIQQLTRQGIQTASIHHPRKGTVGNLNPNKLDDIYGSRWITSGHGSILMMTGEPGATIAQLEQRKSPYGLTIPTLTVIHSFSDGMITGGGEKEILVLLAFTSMPTGFTLLDAVKELCGKDVDQNHPYWKKNSERIRRKLKDLVTAGVLVEGPKINRASAWIVGPNA